MHPDDIAPMLMKMSDCKKYSSHRKKNAKNRWVSKFPNRQETTSNGSQHRNRNLN